MQSHCVLSQVVRYGLPCACNKMNLRCDVLCSSVMSSWFDCTLHLFHIQLRQRCHHFSNLAKSNHGGMHLRHNGLCCPTKKFQMCCFLYFSECRDWFQSMFTYIMLTVLCSNDHKLTNHSIADIIVSICNGCSLRMLTLSDPIVSPHISHVSPLTFSVVNVCSVAASDQLFDTIT